MSKICKEALKTTYEELVGIKEALEAVKKYDDSYSEDIRRSITYYKNQWIIGKINTISIDEFYKFKSGIRLAALHAAGIHTIGQLRGRNINELIAIPGIGPESAQKLKQYEQQVYQEIGDQFYVSFAENDKNQLTEYLVKRTYAKINNKENCKKVNVLLNENFNKMKRIEELKKSQTFWNSFLSTKKERTKTEKEILPFCAECKNGYSSRKRLDRKKLQHCNENGVTIIYWDYDEPITQLILEKKLSEKEIKIAEISKGE